MLRRRFEPDLLMMRRRPARGFLTDPRTALAAVLLFDQIPRNLYRGRAQAYAFDPLARALTHGVLSREWDKRLSPRERQFLYMPLMHSEQMADQRLSLLCFARLPRDLGWPWAVDHYRAIARFGRFPHRNHALARTSTPAERRAVEAGLNW